MSRYKESPEYRELRCPCCGKPMQEMEVLDTYMGWDDEMYAESHYKYRCKECNIKYDEKDKEWKLPKGYEATITPKQIDYLNFLYNGVTRYPYDFDYLGRPRSVYFDKYTPDVLSKEFATRLIQDQVDARLELNKNRKKQKEFEDCIEKYGINPRYHYGDEVDGVESYGLNIEDVATIIFKINTKTYELDLNHLRINIEDTNKFLSLNLQEYVDILIKLKCDLINLNKD